MGKLRTDAGHRTDGDKSTEQRTGLTSNFRARGRHHVGFPFWFVAAFEDPRGSQTSNRAQRRPPSSEPATPTLAQPILSLPSDKVRFYSVRLQYSQANHGGAGELAARQADSYAPPNCSPAVVSVLSPAQLTRVDVSLDQEDPQLERSRRAKREQRPPFQRRLGAVCAHFEGRKPHMEASCV